MTTFWFSGICSFNITEAALLELGTLSDQPTEPLGVDKGQRLGQYCPHSSWPTYTGDEINGADKRYQYVGTTTNGGGSSYFATVNEYTDSAGQNADFTKSMLLFTCQATILGPTKSV
jgi:hypothetical protein